MRALGGYLGIGFFIPVFIFLAIINWILGIRYKKSKKFRGKVIDSKGTEIVKINSRCGEIYETYNVSYDYKGKMLEGEVCTSEKGLKPGANIVVYIYDPEGVHEIQSDINWRKYKFYAGYSLFVIALFLMLSLLIWSLRSSMETTAPQTHSYTHVSDYNDEEMKKQIEQYLEYKKELETYNAE